VLVKKAKVKKFSRAQRISIVDDVLGGVSSRSDTCHRHLIDETELNSWICQHGGDRVVELDEFRMPRGLHFSCYGLWLRQRQLESLLRNKSREFCALKQLAIAQGFL
jgi:hypothetical protein